MKIYHSSSYQSLVAQLAIDIKNSSQSIFQPELIVGANNITQNYIKEQLTDANGIAANLSFKQWNDFAQMIFHAIKPDTFTSSYITPTQTTAYIFEALTELDENEFPKVTNYFQNNASKRFGLAQKIYSLFSNYIKFQPKILMNWESGLYNFDEENSNDEKWQAALWKIVRANIREANLYDEFEIYVQINSSDLTGLKSKIPTVHVVRTETLSVDQLDILKHLSQEIEINILQLATPKNDDPNHLASLWKGNQYILEDHLPHHNFIEIDRGKNHQSTALTQIQDLLSGKNTAFITDESLKIDGHYTPYREVEGLFNHLIKRFEQNNENKTREITVYCNDIKQYIPAIHYFFSNEEAKIPYRIFGEYTYQQNTSLHALEALLKYDLEKLNPEELMGIIQMPTVAQKFGFYDFEAIRNWISKANIRYGYEGDTSIELDLISWKKGLERLILGSLIGDEVYNQTNELIDATEGAGYNQLIALEYFVRKLIEFKSIFDQLQNIQQWIYTTHQFIETFLLVEADPYINNFIVFINQLQNEKDEQLTLSTWLTMLKGYFAEIPTIIRPNSNGITFTELKNTQVIPSTVSAVLGLNYNNYPSQDQALSFDLLQHHAEHKASSRKEKDKYNFLQIILQTKEQLLLSYNSFSPKNNKELPPSIVLEQLMDLTNNQLKVTHHPLHGFSTKYNQNNKALYSYTQQNILSKNVLDQLETLEDVTKVQPKEEIIPLNQFINFFKDSFKHFYNKSLGIYIKEESNELSNHEILETNSLIDWAIRDHFISHPKNYFDLSPEEKLQELRQFKLQGKLPLNQLGLYYADQAMYKYEDVINAFYEKIKEKSFQEKNIEYKIKLDATTYIIKGKINLCDDELIFPILSSNKNKYKFEWLVKSMLLDIEQQKSCLIYKTKDSTEMKQFDKEVVNKIISIEDLLKHYLSEELNPFYITYSLEEIEDFETLKSKLDNDSYLSEYVAQTISKPIFRENETLIQRFIQNHNLIFNLINA